MISQRKFSSTDTLVRGLRARDYFSKKYCLLEEYQLFMSSGATPHLLLITEGRVVAKREVCGTTAVEILIDSMVAELKAGAEC